MRTEEQQREYDADMEQAAMSQGEYMSAAVRQYAAVYGAEDPTARWVLSPFDSWENNPAWDGTDPDQPHPEDERGQQEYYVVGQHAVNLYEDDKEDRLYTAWSVGNDMVHLYNDENFPVPF
jgi:hypothetical protein